MGILDSLLGNSAADAANKAAADQYAKEQAAIAGIKQAGDQYAGGMSTAAQAYNPYVQAGGSGLARLLAGLGLGGDGGAFTSAYQSLPGYQSGLDTGTMAAMRGLNAGPGLQSGRALKALYRYGSDYEDQRSGDYLNRLASLTGMGLGATGSQAGMIGQGLQGQLGAQQSAFGGGMQSAGTIGQGMVAGEQAKQSALQNLLGTAAYLGGAALGGPLAGKLGGQVFKSASNNMLGGGNWITGK